MESSCRRLIYDTDSLECTRTISWTASSYSAWFKNVSAILPAVPQIFEGSAMSFQFPSLLTCLHYSRHKTECVTHARIKISRILRTRYCQRAKLPDCTAKYFVVGKTQAISISVRNVSLGYGNSSALSLGLVRPAPTTRLRATRGTAICLSRRER